MKELQQRKSTFNFITLLAKITHQSFSVSKERLLKCLLDHCILIDSESLSQSEYCDHLYILTVVLQKPKMIDQ